jgi:hypothetical protein
MRPALFTVRDRGASVGALREEFPRRLRAAGPRVLKQNRGNGGEGVWKIELASESGQNGAVVRVLHAPRGSVPQEMPLGDFMSRCEPYFANDGCVVISRSRPGCSTA